ncbi:MAG: branched-chain amino acid ABC transporter permease [Rhodomicrobium sp.]
MNGMRAAIPLLILAAVCSAPVLATSYYLYLTELAMINIIIAAGLNLLSGNCGLISLCNASFMAAGAYGTVLLVNQGISWFAAMPAAAFLTFLLGAVVGFPARRLSGLYLALVTLGFLELVQIAIEESPDFTGGIRGLKVARPEVFGIPFHSETAIYLLVVTLAAAAILAAWNIQNSRFGRAFDAVRQSQFAAQALGIPVARVKLLAFAINAAFAGCAGGLFAVVAGFIDPTEFGVLESLKHITFIVVGGLGSVVGSIIGAVLLTVLPEALRGTQEYSELIYGLILLGSLMFMPRGLVGLLEKLPNWKLSERARKETVHGAP